MSQNPEAATPPRHGASRSASGVRSCTPNPSSTRMEWTSVHPLNRSEFHAASATAQVVINGPSRRWKAASNLTQTGAISCPTTSSPKPKLLWFTNIHPRAQSQRSARSNAIREVSAPNSRKRNPPINRTATIPAQLPRASTISDPLPQSRTPPVIQSSPIR